MKDAALGIMIVLGIIAITLFGGIKNSQTSGNQSSIPTPEQQQMSTDQIAYNLQNAQYQTEALQQQVTAEQEAKISSQYKGQITMSWGSYGNTDPNQEYIEIDANYSNTKAIDITGWTLTSTSTNQRITIPQSTSLYFSNNLNGVGDVRLSPGERVYIISGRSPLSYGMHVNICSGYLSQASTFVPSLYTNCPAPRNEDLKSIPRTPNNNNCFDLIDSLSSCQTGPTLNNTYSYECQQFVETKLNYQSCVDTHKGDADFYSPKEWYVYLQRDQVIWQPRRETVILTDAGGKKVYTITR